MSVALDLAFNLAVNAIGSFAVASAVAWVACKVLRVPDGQWRQLFLALPLAKVAYDMARGVPPDAFFWQRLEGATQDLGNFRIGFGIDAGIPLIDLGLGAISKGITRSQSIAEPLATFLSRQLGASTPSTAAAAVLVVSAVLVVVRLVRSIASLVEASRLRHRGLVIDRRRIGVRSVDIVVAFEHEGVPFAAGLVRPFVCLPGEAFEVLSLDEREAVIGHEIGHLVHHDLLLFSALALFADVLWFVPGLRSRCGAIRSQAEIAADHAAITSGADASALASALVRVAELSSGHASPALSLLTPTCHPSLLSQRVHALLTFRPPRERARPLVVARWLGAAWTVAIVLRAAAFGNH